MNQEPQPTQPENKPEVTQEMKDALGTFKLTQSVPKPPKKAKPKKQTKADRVITAAEAVLEAVDEAQRKVDEAKEAYETLQAELEGAVESVEEAMDNLRSVREDEYQGWYDNLPEGLQSSPVGEKLQALLEIDLDQSMPELPDFEEPDFSDIASAAQEIIDIDYPLGFGRD